MRNFRNDKILSVIIVFALAWLIVNPGIWFTCIGLILEVAVVCFAAKIVARLLFGKSLKELIFGDK